MNCLQCSKPFSGRRGSKFCSRACFCNSIRLVRALCKHCRVNLVKTTRAVYCSVQCSDAALTLYPKTLTCLRCGTDFARNVGTGRTVYCSNRCRHAAMRKGSFQIARMRAKELAIAYAEAEGRPNPINSMPITGTA